MSAKKPPPSPSLEDRRNPWLDPRLVDFTVGDRADRNADRWQRATFAALAVIVILGIGLVVSATTRHSVVAVFRENTDGTRAYIGQAAIAKDAPPASTLAIEHDLALWIHCLRAIPNHDPELLAQDGECVFALVQPGSQAYNVIAAMYRHHPPLEENATQQVYRDTVKVEVYQDTPLSYHITYIDMLYVGGQLRAQIPSSVGITLAGPPTPSTVPSIARRNPLGIEISTIDPHWSNAI